MTKISGKIKFLIIAALVLISAAAMTYVNSYVKIDYCKNTIKLDDGLAILKEDGLHAAVITLDNNGEITGRANILLNDPFTLSVKSVHDLFSDDKGNLYVFCSIYGPKRSVYETIYKCNFFFGSGRRIWSSKQADGYDVIQGSTPYIDGNDIYLPMLNKGSRKTDILKFSGGGHTVVSEDCVPDGVTDADRIFYRNGVVFCAEDTSGVFANGERIYPRNGDDAAAGIYDAMNYDNGILSFVDITKNRILHYDMNTGAFSDESCGIYSFNRLQSLRAYSGGTITAACEDGEYLRAYRYSGGSEETFSLVNGGLFLRSFLIFIVISAVAAALLVLIYTLLFVRIRKQKDGTRRYQSIAARITAISTAAGIICGIVFGVLINGTVERLNSGLQDSIDTNGSQFLAGCIYTDCEIELKNGVPRLNSRSGEDFNKTIESYQTALGENNGIECYFLLLAESGGRLYQLEDQFDDTVPAEYVVSLRSAGLIQSGIDSGVNCAFEDKMTSGRSQYTCTNFPISGADGTEYNGVLCTVSDAYRIRQMSFMLYVWLIAVIFLLVVLLLVAANIVLHRSLSGLKRLRKAFALYESDENGGDPSVFLLPGNEETSDEISETGHALMLMTEGTRVHTRDISEGNRKYKRFMAAGILKLMDRSEISKVNFGDRVSANALILRFSMDDSSDITESVKLINGFIEMSGGILLNFVRGKADVCFTDEKEFGRAADTAARLGYPSAVLASFGKVEAGSAGSDSNAWLIALSEEFAEFERLDRLRESGDPSKAPMICTKKAAEKLKDDRFLSRCELREDMLGDIEFFDIIPRESGGKNERETADNNTDGINAADGSLDPVL